MPKARSEVYYVKAPSLSDVAGMFFRAENCFNSSELPLIVRMPALIGIKKMAL